MLWNVERLDHLLNVERLNLHHACLGIGELDKSVVSRYPGEQMSVSLLLPWLVVAERTSYSSSSSRL